MNKIQKDKNKKT